MLLDLEIAVIIVILFPFKIIIILKKPRKCLVQAGPSMLWFFYASCHGSMRLLLIWSRTHSVPRHLVPHNWSPRTNSPDSFGPHGQMVPKTIGPPGQLVPKHLVPMDKWSPRQLVPMDNWSPKFISSFQKWFGTLFPIFWGTICPWGPNVRGPFVHGDQMSRDCLFLGTNCGGPNVWGLNVFGTK